MGVSQGFFPDIRIWDKAIPSPKISGYQQRWPRPLPGAILIPSALLVVADLAVSFPLLK
jgi:hypothetical protein